MHRLRFNKKTSYWLRAQLPDHPVDLLNRFKTQQTRLIASYHVLYDEEEFQLRFEELKGLYLRASFPIELSGMGLRNVEVAHLAAFISSMTVTTRSLAKAFPSWIQLGAGGEVTQVDPSRSPPKSQQVAEVAQRIQQR